MNRLMIWSVFILICSTCFFCGCFDPESKQSTTRRTWIVGSKEQADFTSIQQAINTASQNDIIQIQPGIYSELIIISKSITIHGQNQSRVTITPPKNNNENNQIISVTADDCNISNLIIKSTPQIKNNSITGLYCNSSNNVFNNLSIINCNYGIHCTKGLYSKKEIDEISEKTKTQPNPPNENNIFTNINCSYCSIGIRFSMTNNHSVSNSSFHWNNETGLICRDFSENIQIKNNTFLHNQKGIHLKGVEQNTISFNRFEKNTIGVYLCCHAINNSIFQNDFIRNNETHAFPYENNNWYLNKKGNYWDDYAFIDKDLNGIGDQPYNISSDDSIQDLYPLMNPTSS